MKHPSIELSLARDFDRGSYINDTWVLHYIRYGLKDNNDSSARLLQLLYYDAEFSDRLRWEGIAFSIGHHGIIDRHWRCGIIYHDNQFFNNGDFTYYRHEPHISYNGLNGDTTITLLVPKPSLAMWWLFWILGVSIQSEYGTIQYYTEVSGYMRITSKLKNIYTNRLNNL